MSIKWKMIDHNTFTGEYEDYQINIKCGEAFGYNYWDIIKNDVVLTNAFKHSPSKGDLQGKCQVERILKQLING